jgi:hypothetical protein
MYICLAPKTRLENDIHSVAFRVAVLLVMQFSDEKLVRVLQCFSTAGPRTGIGPPSCKKRIYWGRGLTKVENHWCTLCLLSVLQAEWYRM